MRHSDEAMKLIEVAYVNVHLRHAHCSRFFFLVSLMHSIYVPK